MKNHISGPEKGVIRKGVFPLEKSLESLKSLDSLESLENGRNLLYFPQFEGSLESLESLNSLESLENGLVRKDPFSKRPLFPNPNILANKDGNMLFEFQKKLFESAKVLGIRKGGGQNVSCDFGGGETYHKAPPPKPVLEASESGICLVCARFL